MLFADGQWLECLNYSFCPSDISEPMSNTCNALAVHVCSLFVYATISCALTHRVVLNPVLLVVALTKKLRLQVLLQ